MSYDIDDIDELMCFLINKKNRMESGEKLCRSQYLDLDDGYDCRCTGCGESFGFVESVFDIPFEEDGYCDKCPNPAETPEIIEGTNDALDKLTIFKT